MKITIRFAILALLGACNFTSTTNAPNKYAQMDELWRKKAFKKEVIEAFGQNHENVKSGILFKFTNSRYPELGFFFDEMDRLKTQFALAKEKDLSHIKKYLPCNWIETEEMKSTGHTFVKIKKGNCVARQIKYEYRPDLRHYEFRWEKSHPPRTK